jgi:hypothetical protein
MYTTTPFGVIVVMKADTNARWIFDMAIVRTDKRPWTKKDDELLMRLWQTDLAPSQISVHMRRTGCVIRVHARLLKLPKRRVKKFVNPDIPPVTGVMRKKDGLPQGHLKPWPDMQRMFEDVPVTSGLARTIRPEPLNSSGVAHYG